MVTSLKCDIERVEKVQRQFTKRLYGFKHLCYEERLTKLRIPSLISAKVEVCARASIRLACLRVHAKF